MSKLKVSGLLYDKMLEDFLYNGKEKGGLVFLKGEEIHSYFLDEKGSGCKKTYIPDSASLRKAIASASEKGCTEFCFIHCHPNYEPISMADIEYIRRFLELNELRSIKQFIVQTDVILCYKHTINSCELIQIDRQEQ